MSATIHSLAAASARQQGRASAVTPSSSVPSIPTRRIAEVLNDKGMLRAIDDRPDLYGSLRESWSHEPVRDPSTGGAWGIALMFLVAGFIGLLLATGGAL